MAEPEGAELREAAGLARAGRRVLLVATEGVTDPAGYAAAVGRRRAGFNGGHVGRVGGSAGWNAGPQTPASRA